VNDYLILTFPEHTLVQKGFDNVYALIDKTGKLMADENYIYLLSENRIYSLTLGKTTREVSFNLLTELPELFTKYEPVIYRRNHKSIIYLLSDEGNVYSYKDGLNNRIFELRKFTNEEPSQLALTDGEISSLLLLHTERNVYLLTEDGSFHPRFPRYLENNRLKPNTHPYIFNFSGETILLLHDAKQGLLAMDLNGRTRHEFSHYWDMGVVLPRFFLDRNNYLNMIYSDQNGTVYSGAKKAAPHDMIIWNGFRNCGTGLLEHTPSVIAPPVITLVDMFIYPNPVRQQMANLRILNTHSEGTVKIYNIAGQLVLSENIGRSVENFRDFRFETNKLSSGAYFVHVDIDGHTYRDRFAIVK